MKLTAEETRILKTQRGNSIEHMEIRSRLAEHDLKWCHLCHTVQTPKDFHKNAGNRDGLGCLCKSCDRRTKKCRRRTGMIEFGRIEISRRNHARETPEDRARYEARRDSKNYDRWRKDNRTNRVRTSTDAELREWDSFDAHVELDLRRRIRLGLTKRQPWNDRPDSAPRIPD